MPWQHRGTPENISYTGTNMVGGFQRQPEGRTSAAVQMESARCGNLGDGSFDAPALPANHTLWYLQWVQVSLTWLRRMFFGVGGEAGAIALDYRGVAVALLHEDGSRIQEDRDGVVHVPGFWTSSRSTLRTFLIGGTEDCSIS